MASADDDHLACRGQGHAFPKVRARGGRLTGAKAVRRQRDGAFQIEQVCPDCRTERTLTISPTGYLDRTTGYAYRWPEGYRVPAGTGEMITRADCFAETVSRAEVSLVAAAIATEAAEGEAETA